MSKTWIQLVGLWGAGTPLHRAAHLAHLDGYVEIYEYLLVRRWGRGRRGGGVNLQGQVLNQHEGKGRRKGG
jgi:hypothetical protein